MIKTDVDISGLLNRLNNFENKLDTIPWPYIGRTVQESIKRNFDLGGRPDKWKPRTRQYNWPILKKTLDLKRSIDTNLIKNGVSVGTRGISYAKFHQYGTKKMVARPFVMVQAEDMEEIKKEIIMHLRKK